MSSCHTSDFVNNLAQLGFLAEVELSYWTERLAASCHTDEHWANAFVRARLLTPFQAGCVLHKRWRGLHIGSYRILSPLSSGGMGEIYVARHQVDGQLCAVKLLKRSLRSKRRSRQRFALEAFALSSLEHPNVPRLLEHRSSPNQRNACPYLVTELIEGPSLQELIRIRKQLPWQQACNIVAQAAEGLHHAHERGVLHRDVKPGNVLMTSDGTARIIDFGLAEYLGDDAEARRRFAFSSRNRAGTPRFSAPEQFAGHDSGKAAPFSPAADVYGLGATLVVCLTGKLLPKAKHRQCPARARRLIENYSPSVPAAVSHLVQQCLQVDPRARPQSAAQVAEVLNAVGERFPIEIDFYSLQRARQSLRQSRGDRHPLTRDLPSVQDTTVLASLHQPSCSTDAESVISDSRIDSKAEEDQAAENQLLRTQIDERELELTRLREQLQVAREQLGAEREHRQRERQLLTDQNAKLREASRLVKQQLSDAVSQQRAGQERNQVLCAQLRQWQARHDRLSSQLADQGEQIPSLQQTIAGLQGQLVELHRDRDAQQIATRERDRLRDRLQHVEPHFQASLRHVSNLRNWLRRATRLARHHQQVAAESNRQLGKMAYELEQQTSMAATAQSRFERELHTERLATRQLTVQVDSLRQKLESRHVASQQVAGRQERRPNWLRHLGLGCQSVLDSPFLPSSLPALQEMLETIRDLLIDSSCYAPGRWKSVCAQLVAEFETLERRQLEQRLGRDCEPLDLVFESSVFDAFMIADAAERV